MEEKSNAIQEVDRLPMISELIEQNPKLCEEEIGWLYESILLARRKLREDNET